MFYELAPKSSPPDWPVAVNSVRAVRAADGREVGIPVCLDANVLVVGTSGYGKTVFTKEYVKALFAQDEKLYGVFFQIKPDDFTETFLRPQDKVIAYGDQVCPGGNLFQWNLVKEIRSLPPGEWETALDELTSILFSDLLQDSRNRVWADAARNVFKAFVKVILYQYGNNPSNQKLIGAMRDMPRKELLAFLAEHPPNRGMLRDNFDYDPVDPRGWTMPRKGSDIFFFLQNVLEKFGGSFLLADGEDTIFDYLCGSYGERLFLVHDHKKRNSTKLFERYFLKYIADDLLSQTSVFSGRMLWVLDEIDKVEGDFGLTQAVTLGRQFGLQTIVSTQSMESLYAIAPELHGEHLTNAALSGFSVTAAFHPGDPHTIETLRTLYGKRLKQTVVMPFSRYEKPIISTEQRPVVEESDFAGLGIGECYIKILSAGPERVRILI